MEHTMNLSSGNIKRQLVSLAIPLMVGNVLQQLYNTVDALVIGKYAGPVAFAAIGVAGTVMNLFIFILSGCCTGISIMLGQLFGMGDLEKFRNGHFLSFVFGGSITIAISLLGILFLNPMLKFIQTPADIALYARDYLVIIFVGLIAAFFYNLNAAVLRAVGNTNAALIVLAISVVVNFGLDLLFVSVFSWGIKGAAIATVISQLLSVICGTGYVLIKIPALMFRRDNMQYDAGLMRKTVTYGAISALHQSSLYIGKLLVQGAVNSAGIDTISAYTASTRIEGFANSFGDSGGAATSIFIAQNEGADHKERVREGMRMSMIIMVLLGAALSGIMAITSGSAVGLMLGNNTQTALHLGIQYIGGISVFYTLCYIGNVFVGYYRGVGMVNIPVIGTVLHISLRVILSYLLVPRMGLLAVAVATGIGWIAVVLFQSVLYFRKNPYAKAKK